MDSIGQALYNLISSYGGISLFFILLIEESGVPLPIPGDGLLLFSGFLISQRTLFAPFVIVAAFLGVICGSSILYFIGHKGGRPFVRKFGKYFLLPESRVNTYSELFQRHSSLAIIVGRYIPGMRVIFSFLAGLFGLPYKKFISQVAIASIIWVGGLITIGVFLGSRWENANEIFTRYWYVFIIIFIISLAVSIYKASRSTKKKPQTQKSR